MYSLSLLSVTYELHAFVIHKTWLNVDYHRKVYEFKFALVDNHYSNNFARNLRKVLSWKSYLRDKQE